MIGEMVDDIGRESVKKVWLIFQKGGIFHRKNACTMTEFFLSSQPIKVCPVAPQGKGNDRHLIETI
jgi:hypothetical protein